MLDIKDSIAIRSTPINEQSSQTAAIASGHGLS